jgi:Zinc carboxypeptidase
MIVLLAIVISCSSVFNVQANYETKSAIIGKFMDLVAAHPTQASYVSIGKSVKGSDILMFKFGNSSATGRILWDAQMHGSEDAGSETAYLFCVWLFSGDAATEQILAHNWILVIPVVNIDTTARPNADHVNLNRNFPVGWGHSGSTNPTSDEYMGPSAGSEPETKALINVFMTYNLKFYINSHMYGGPRIYYNSAIPSSFMTLLKQRLSNLNHFLGGSPVNTNGWTRMSSGGFAMTAAETYGAYSFLWEIGGTTRPPLSSVTGQYYLETRCFLVALTTLC